MEKRVEAAAASEAAAVAWGTSLETRLEKAEADLASARAEVDRSAALAEAARTEGSRAAEARLASTQGATFRAVAERLLLSDSFSATVAELTRLVVPRFLRSALKAAAKDFSGLDPSRYSTPPLGRDELNRQYVATILRGLDGSPVLQALAEVPDFVAEDRVVALEVDRDAELDAAAVTVRAELARKGPEVEVLKGAEVEPQKESEVELPKRLLGEDVPGPTPDDDVGAEIAEKDFEILKLKSLVRNLDDEWRSKYDKLQEERDGTLARLMRMQEKVGMLRADLKEVQEEHGEYENIIHRCHGSTISEVVCKVDELYAKVADCEERHGTDSQEYSKSVAALRRLMKMYQIAQKRRPDVSRFLKSVPVPCFSQNSPPRADYDHFERQPRRALPPARGRNRAPSRAVVVQSASRSRSSGSASTSQGKKKVMNIDQILNFDPESPPHPFELKWLHCSEGQGCQSPK